MKKKAIIKKIQAIREKNNKPWMKILEIAFECDPVGASKCMRDICRMDKQITKLARKLSK